MRRDRIPLRQLTFLIVSIFLLPACGKKDDPMPPQVNVPAVAQLDVTSSREGILLTWSLSDPSKGVAGFRFVRSEIVQGSQVCLGCPQVYRPYVTVAIADERLQREGDRGFRYLDTDVRVGNYYSYRILACDRAGHCGGSSTEAAMRHTVP